MTTATVVVIGAGQAGLATSQVLTRAGIDHLVIERGTIGHSWRTERWPSLRLLTPNWLTRLPGGAYRGPDPDGFMPAREVAAFLEHYALGQQAPVLEQTAVLSVRRSRGRFVVATTRGTFRAHDVVVATGAASRPRLPAFHGSVHGDLEQRSPLDYKGPDSVRPGGVLVVGASASGVQLADELSRAGREVTLCVGRHTRLPRRTHGRDILWWLDRLGRLSAEIPAGRHEESLQLVGSPEARDLDLGHLHRRGVRLLGRAVDLDGTRLRTDGRLGARVAAADQRLTRVLDRIDRASGVLGPRPAPLALDAPPATLDLRREGIHTVVWATGLGPSVPWLEVQAPTDARGVLANRGGVTPVPGLYVVGMPGQIRRNSAQIDGVGFVARGVGRHITGRCHHLTQPLALAS